MAKTAFVTKEAAFIDTILWEIDGSYYTLKERDRISGGNISVIKEALEEVERFRNNLTAIAEKYQKEHNGKYG